MAIKIPILQTISAMVWLAFSLVSNVSAQQGFDSTIDLPSVRDLSSALSDPSSRSDALLTMIALSKLGQISPAALESQLPTLEAEFRDNREWLDRLASRFSKLPARGTLLDPAAWFVQQELSQHAITPSKRVSPLGPDYRELLEQLFDRTDERLAAAFLPEALFNVEFVASSVWTRLLEQSQSNQILQQLLLSLNADWFELWQAAEPPAPLGSDNRVELLESSLAHLQAMMGSVILPQAPDNLRVKRVRFGLLNALPTMEPDQASTARHLLSLTTAVNGLHDENFLEFIQSLLWVVSDLLEVYGSDPNAWSPIPKLLVDFLPQLSNVMARNFTEVDSRFNANLAATFDVVQELQNGSIDQAALEQHRKELANTITQLVLLVPEIEFYFEQPVRQRISTEIDICISVAAVRDENGSSMMRPDFL